MLSREGQSLEQGQYLLTASEAAEYLRVSLATLHRMEKRGQLVPYRTLGGHRRYSLTMLNDLLERSRNRHLPRAPAAEHNQ